MSVGGGGGRGPATKETVVPSATVTRKNENRSPHCDCGLTEKKEAKTTQNIINKRWCSEVRGGEKETNKGVAYCRNQEGPEKRSLYMKLLRGREGINKGDIEPKQKKNGGY